MTKRLTERFCDIAVDPYVQWARRLTGARCKCEGGQAAPHNVVTATYVSVDARWFRRRGIAIGAVEETQRARKLSGPSTRRGPLKRGQDSAWSGPAGWGPALAPINVKLSGGQLSRCRPFARPRIRDYQRSLAAIVLQLGVNIVDLTRSLELDPRC